MKIDPNDPRLTAYVLGELEDEERQEVEASLAASPEARRALEEIRITAGLISEALKREVPVGLTAEQMEAIHVVSGRGRQRKFGGWYAWSGLAAAASILLVVLVQVHQEPSEKSLLTSIGENHANQLDKAEPPPIRDNRAETAAGQAPGLPQLSRPSPPAVVDRTDSILAETQELQQSVEVRKSDAQAEEGKEGSRREPESDLGVKVKKGEQAQVAGLDPARLTASTPSPPLPKAAPVAPSEQFALELAAGTGGVSPPSNARASREDFAIVGENRFRLSNAFIPGADEDHPGGVPGMPPDFNTEAYDRLVDNPFLRVANNPLSTFSIDVDTASYANVRRYLVQGTLPPKDAVRIEELVNYFSYAYPQPAGDHPFSVNLEATAAPWKPEHRLVKIGLKGREIRQEQRPAANLVFLLDVSGSMKPPNKLPLLKQAMKLVVDRLTERDQVAIAVYAGASGTVLPPTSGNRKEEILAALDRLEAGGSTNGGAGIELAYRLAQTHLVKDGINRVILATDGDFNVGVTNQGDLTRLIEEQARKGIFLSVLGFGMGNYKDSTLEKLADRGNGNYGYIDTLNEARKILVEQMEGTLITIAKDVKIQIEFNPSRVEAYRLIGYENRVLRDEDFNDDTKDAGEIGAGHTVTALYEVVPAGQSVPAGTVDPLRYQRPAQVGPTGELSRELLTVKLRYKEPDGDTSRLIEVPFNDLAADFTKVSPDLRFAAAVASFGMLLRESEYRGQTSFDAVSEIAREGVGEDRSGYRAEFLKLVEIAKRLSQSH